MYGLMFMHLADCIAHTKDEAMRLYREVVEAGIDPEDMEASYSLMMLDLAEEDTVNSIADGGQKFVYFEPDPIPIFLGGNK